MSSANKSRRNAFLAGTVLVVVGIINLLVAYYGYKAQTLIPAGHVEGQFMTPTQGFMIAGVAFAFAAYAFARVFVTKRSGN